LSGYTVDPFYGSEDWEWISFSDVLKVELSREWTEDDLSPAFIEE
jgi:hypothetical protein